jgi:hypothetical protein
MATLCIKKASDWYACNGGYSLEWLDAEIERLARLQLSYEALNEVTIGGTSAQYPVCHR